MGTLLEEFDSVMRDRAGDAYRVSLYGRSRPHDTWQAWLVFVREGDGRRFETAVETAQPDREAILYWATGLTDAYFEGALERALAPLPPATPEAAPPPIIGHGVDATEHAVRRAEIERDILDVFTATGVWKLLLADLFDALNHAHADITRALEHFEQSHRPLQRRTEEGNEWVVLTDARSRAISLEDRPPQP